MFSLGSKFKEVSDLFCEKCQIMQKTPNYAENSKLCRKLQINLSLHPLHLNVASKVREV